MYKILVIDEDPFTKTIIENILSKGSSKPVILYSNSVVGANNLISSHYVDFFIIEISNTTGIGINFALKLREMDRYAFVPIIFISKKIDFIITAYKEARCMDYLLKPLNKYSFITLARYIDMFQNPTHERNKSQNDYLLFHTNQTYFKIPVNEILFIESRDHKCIVHTHDEEIPVPTTIKQTLGLINNEPCLAQSHRSFIININNIRKIDKKSEPRIVHFNFYHKTAFISRSFKKIILEKLKEMTDI